MFFFKVKAGNWKLIGDIHGEDWCARYSLSMVNRGWDIGYVLYPVIALDTTGLEWAYSRYTIDFWYTKHYNVIHKYK